MNAFTPVDSGGAERVHPLGGPLHEEVGLDALGQVLATCCQEKTFCVYPSY